MTKSKIIQKLFRLQAGATTSGVRLFLLWVPAFLLLISAQQSSCSRAKGDQVSQPATTVRPSAFLVRKLEQPALEEVQSMSAKARLFAEGDGMAMEANANLIWIRDSALWINVKKLGIEAMRALVTRDSVFIINRLERSYTADGIESLRRKYSLPEGFPLLQHLLLASAWLAPDVDLHSDIKDSLHRLTGTNNQFSVDYRLEEGSFHLRQETFVQQRNARVLNLQFDQFKKLPGAGLFPYLRRIEAFSPDTGNLHLDIELTDIEVNVPKSYRFEIPAHYQRAE